MQIFVSCLIIMCCKLVIQNLYSHFFLGKITLWITFEDLLYCPWRVCVVLWMSCLYYIKDNMIIITFHNIVFTLKMYKLTIHAIQVSYWRISFTTLLLIYRSLSMLSIIWLLIVIDHHTNKGVFNWFFFSWIEKILKCSFWSMHT